MSIHVKNCGLTTEAAVEASIASGAQYLGFVHHETSPRHLPLEAIASLMRHSATSVRRVVVMVDPADALIDAVAKDIAPDFMQIHGIRDASRLYAIASRARIPLITAIAVREKTDLAEVHSLETVSAHLLFDGKEAGSGIPFDWALLKDIACQKPWFLAGGLTIHNVAEAIRLTHAPMVDVSSGIESAPGVKSREMIAAFNAAVLALSAHES